MSRAWKELEVLALAHKIKVQVGAALVAKLPKGRGSGVEVTLDANQVRKSLIEIPEGDAEPPLSAASLEHKFLKLSTPVLGEAGARKVIALVDKLEEVDARTFGAALRNRA
jgi:2-methylcitrate dehydratase